MGAECRRAALPFTVHVDRQHHKQRYQAARHAWAQDGCQGLAATPTLGPRTVARGWPLPKAQDGGQGLAATPTLGPRTVARGWPLPKAQDGGQGLAATQLSLHAAAAPTSAQRQAQ
jgi:hypothetical protein